MIKIAFILLSLIVLSLAQTPTCTGGKETRCATCDSENRCITCSNTSNTPQSDCYCTSGQYRDPAQTTASCQPCGGVCETCDWGKLSDNTMGKVCTSCLEGPGIGLHLIDKDCLCQAHYFKDTAPAGTDPKTKCKQKYIYGNEAVDACPEGTIQNDQVKICEITKPEEVSNDDQIHIIIVSIVIIVVQFVLSILLYNYLFNKLKEAFTRDQNAVHELSPEERAYLANQDDYEREIALREEQDRKSKSKISSNMDDQSDVIE